MSVNLSLIRNIDSTCRSADGERFDLVLIGESENKKGTFVVEIPRIFNNDYELLFALKNGLSVIEHQPIVKANTAELGTSFEIDDKKAEALKRSHYMCGFLDSSYFYITGNMLRFTIDKKQSFVKFIKDRELVEAYSYEGSIIPCLPDLFIKANLNKNLEITSEGMAIIPTEWKTEILCYEFKGKIDNTDFLVYINAETGKEEDILIIINTPNGILTI